MALEQAGGVKWPKARAANEMEEWIQRGRAISRSGNIRYVLEVTVGGGSWAGRTFQSAGVLRQVTRGVSEAIELSEVPVMKSFLEPRAAQVATREVVIADRGRILLLAVICQSLRTLRITT